MTDYFYGVCIASFIYIIIAGMVNRKIKGIEDFYVSNRNANVAFLVGTIVASSISSPSISK